MPIDPFARWTVGITSEGWINPDPNDPPPPPPPPEEDDDPWGFFGERGVVFPDIVDGNDIVSDAYDKEIVSEGILGDQRGGGWIEVETGAGTVFVRNEAIALGMQDWFNRNPVTGYDDNGQDGNDDLKGRKSNPRPPQQSDSIYVLVKDKNGNNVLKGTHSLVLKALQILKEILKREDIKKLLEQLKEDCPGLSNIIDCLLDDPWQGGDIRILQANVRDDIEPPIEATSQPEERDENGNLIFKDKNGRRFVYNNLSGRFVPSNPDWTPEQDMGAKMDGYIELDLWMIRYSALYDINNGTKLYGNQRQDPDIATSSVLLHELVHACGGGEIEAYALQNLVMGNAKGSNYNVTVSSGGPRENSINDFDTRIQLKEGWRQNHFFDQTRKYSINLSWEPGTGKIYCMNGDDETELTQLNLKKS